jgi:hypothetical protein
MYRMRPIINGERHMARCRHHKAKRLKFTWAGVSGVAVNEVANDNFNNFLNKNLTIRNAA